MNTMILDPDVSIFGGVVLSSLFQALRVFMLLMWVTLAIRLTYPAFRLMTKHIRQHDLLYLVIWGTAVNRLWRWVHDVRFGEQAHTWIEYYWLAAFYVFAIAVGYGFHVIRSVYGDGEPK